MREHDAAELGTCVCDTSWLILSKNTLYFPWDQGRTRRRRLTASRSESAGLGVDRLFAEARCAGARSVLYAQTAQNSAIIAFCPPIGH